MSKEAQTIEVAGKKLTCNHCNNDLFYVKKAQLNTSTMSFLGLDFLNKSANTCICSNCRKIEWFL